MFLKVKDDIIVTMNGLRLAQVVRDEVSDNIFNIELIYEGHTEDRMYVINIRESERAAREILDMILAELMKYYAPMKS